MKIAITGHRPPRLNGHEDEISKWINDKLKVLKPEIAYTGMATGADQLLANECIKENIPFICAYPFPKKYYHPVEEKIKSYANNVEYISNEYSKQSYFIRDKYMVDNCDVLLAVWDGIKQGGTWITIDYAIKCNKKILYYPQELLINNEDVNK